VWCNLLRSSTLKMESIGSSVKLVNTSNITKCINPEAHHLNLHHCDDLKFSNSRFKYTVFNIIFPVDTEEMPNTAFHYSSNA